MKKRLGLVILILMLLLGATPMQVWADNSAYYDFGEGEPYGITIVGSNSKQLQDISMDSYWGEVRMPVIATDGTCKIIFNQHLAEVMIYQGRLRPSRGGYDKCPIIYKHEWYEKGISEAQLSYGQYSVDMNCGGDCVVFYLDVGKNNVLSISDPASTKRINVIINEYELDLTKQQAPVIQNGRVLVPVRAVFEALGAKVSWNGYTQTVTAAKDDKTILMTIGNSTAIVNGKSYTLDAAPINIGGRTMVPLRFMAESLGCKVNWDANHKTVYIFSSGTNK